MIVRGRDLGRFRMEPAVGVVIAKKNSFVLWQARGVLSNLRAKSARFCALPEVRNANNLYQMSIRIRSELQLEACRPGSALGELRCA